MELKPIVSIPFPREWNKGLGFRVTRPRLVLPRGLVTKEPNNNKIIMVTGGTL